MVCIKDQTGRYIDANDAFVRRARRRRVSDVIGRTAADLFPPELAASYEAQDRAVLLTGQAIRNHLEVIAGLDGDHSRWFLTTKVVTRSREHGDVLVVVSTDAQFGDRADAATGLRAAIEVAHERFADRLRVTDLATAAGMSSDRLERTMRRVLNISPKQYIVRLRTEHAARLLATTERSVAEIAAHCGYYDQSQLTRQFRDHVGLSPTEYRRSARAELPTS